MPRTQNPLIGRTRGTIGNAYLSTRRGQNLISTSPPKRGKRYTLAQRQHYARMRAVARLWRSLGGIRRYIRKNPTWPIQGWATFFRDNVPECTELGTLTPRIYPNLINWDGNNDTARYSQVSSGFIAAGLFEVVGEWPERDDRADGEPQDLVYAILWDDAAQELHVSPFTPGTRADLTGSATFEVVGSSNDLYFWAFFLSKEKGRMSTTSAMIHPA